MLPVTHYLYLALTLFCVGLGGALLRRSLVAALLSIQLMLASVALCLSAYGRMFIDEGAQVMASLVVLVGLCELAIVVAVVVRMLRFDEGLAAEGRDAGPGPSIVDDWTLGGLD